VTTARRLIALLSALFLVPLIAVTTATSTASAADDAALFKPMPGFTPSASSDASVRPTHFKAYRADLAGIRAQLAGGGAATLTIPDPAGTPTEFNVVEDSVMEPELQAAHPDIRTYAGAAANGTSIRLDVSPLGFHAMVRRPDGVVWYVEPATRNVGESRVLSFAGSAAGAPAETFVEKQVQRAQQDAAALADSDQSFSTPGGIVTQRTFRLAFLTDPTYAAFVAPGAATHVLSDPLVLAAKVSLINRVNEPYNDDVAYKFLLVNGTDTKLNLLNAPEMTGTNGPCGASACFTAGQAAGCTGGTLTRNIFALGMLVGADTFDIGHIGFGLNGGGVAGLGVVGGASKARGCTGLPQPIGDVYAIDYVAHEMGHQMGGNHTFNGTQVNCSGSNRNGATSVEPGSGTSIQAYAGICGSDNLQPHSDPYFSFKSIDEFEATTAVVRANLSEQQVVSFTGLVAGDQLTIDCATGCTPTNVTFTGVGATDLAAFSTAVSTATGSTASVTGYDGAAQPSAAGFTATWTLLTDVPRLVVTPVTGTSTNVTGVVRNGGPQGNGGTLAVTTNHSPVVTGPADKTIPRQTPFTLTGSATDADSDTLTYLWEQTDNGIGVGTGLVDNNKTNGPLFRVFGVSAQVSASDTLLYHSPGENIAGTVPSRTFPDLPQILAGNTNAATGTCPAPAASGTIPVSDPALNCFSEFLPTSAWVGTGDRVMHFRFTARDEFTADAGADDPGGVTWDDVALTVDPAAGPFLVTSRATAGSPAAGAENVTWDVAGTAGAALAPNVKISLSTDSGLTYPTVLAASTPNDGSQVVTLPNINTTTARIKVEAVGNYFFDINNADFTIKPAAPASTIEAKAEPKKITEGHKFKVKATVTTASGVPAGTVEVYLGTKLLGTGTLKSNGKVTIKISEKKAKKLKVGKNTLTAKYLGSATVAPSQDDFVIKVRKKKK
jgi:hypothetical protein